MEVGGFVFFYFVIIKNFVEMIVFEFGCDFFDGLVIGFYLE